MSTRRCPTIECDDFRYPISKLLIVVSAVLALLWVLVAAPTAFAQGPGEAAIAIDKLTNGEDADTPIGPGVEIGDIIVWTYHVTNTGTVPLSILVTDDQGVTVGCDTTKLLPGAAAVCNAFGFAQPGQYANTGTVVGTPLVGAPVTASDPSHYFGADLPQPKDPSIRIEKFTNLVDADTPSGPFILTGDPVTWTYVVVNNGNQSLFDVAVTDDQGVSVSCPETELAPFESMICTANGIAESGQYANIATVVGTPDGPEVSDTDPSHYFGALPSIDIEKATNGEDADTPTGPIIPVGDPVFWTYVVTNDGNVFLTDVTVTDDQGVIVTCPQDTLAVGESMTCTGATGVAQAGQYANTATTTGTPPVGPDVTDNDPSHYFGALPSIDIEKATNGEDADTPTGPMIDIGDDVIWTYVVVNTGNVSLSNVVVTDDQGVTVTCPQDTLAVGESMTCTASGIAEEGQYANLGTVTGRYGEEEVSDTDPSHYFGQDSTGLDDDDQPTAPPFFFLPKLST